MEDKDRMKEREIKKEQTTEQDKMKDDLKIIKRTKETDRKTMRETERKKSETTTQKQRQLEKKRMLTLQLNSVVTPLQRAESCSVHTDFTYSHE